MPLSPQDLLLLLPLMRKPQPSCCVPPFRVTNLLQVLWTLVCWLWVCPRWLGLVTGVCPRIADSPVFLVVLLWCPRAQ